MTEKRAKYVKIKRENINKVKEKCSIVLKKCEIQQVFLFKIEEPNMETAYITSLVILSTVTSKFLGLS